MQVLKKFVASSRKGGKGVAAPSYLPWGGQVLTSGGGWNGGPKSKLEASWKVGVIDWGVVRVTGFPTGPHF